VIPLYQILKSSSLYNKDLLVFIPLKTSCSHLLNFHNSVAKSRILLLAIVNFQVLWRWTWKSNDNTFHSSLTQYFDTQVAWILKNNRTELVKPITRALKISFVWWIEFNCIFIESLHVNGKLKYLAFYALFPIHKYLLSDQFFFLR